jgi:hypothetical protein
MELHNLFSSLNVIGLIKSRGMQWATSVFEGNENCEQKHFIFPTDAHYYKIVEMLKQFKIITLAPTCFGSRRNHHQGAVLCLTKTTNMILLCSSV